MRLVRCNRLGVFALLLTLALVGCGEGDDETTASKQGNQNPKAENRAPKAGSNVPKAGKTVTAKVILEHQKGIPADVGQWMVDIGVKPGNDLAFTVAKAIIPPGNTNFQLINPQAVGHNLVLEEVGAGSVETPVIRKKSAWVRISLFVGKRYVFYCSVPGHRQAGMEGTIKIDSQLTTEDLKAY